MGDGVVRYVRMGRVERARRGQYVWMAGYSENGVCQPWMTKTEARKDAALQGKRAVFVEAPVEHREPLRKVTRLYG